MPTLRSAAFPVQHAAVSPARHGQPSRLNVLPSPQPSSAGSFTGPVGCVTPPSAAVLTLDPAPAWAAVAPAADPACPPLVAAVDVRPAALAGVVAVVFEPDGLSPPSALQ